VEVASNETVRLVSMSTVCTSVYTHGCLCPLGQSSGTCL